MRYFRAIFILPILLPLGLFVGIFWAVVVSIQENPIDYIKELGNE
jgi:hypothetical protein